MHSTQRTFLIMIALLTGACAGLPSSDQGTGSPTHSEAANSAAATDDDAGKTVVARDLRWIIERLQDGQLVAAREALVAYLKREPANATAKSLLQQIDTDPVALLGKTHTTYTVRPGDTMGALAGRFLGDPLRFVALARYNGIDRARTLAAGQTLKVPTARMSQAQVVDVGGEALPAPTGSAGEREEVHRRRIEVELAAGRGDTAAAAIEQARADAPGNGAWNAWLDPMARRAMAVAQQQRGIALMERRQHEAAYEAFGQALAQEPELEPARRHRASLRGVLVAEYHKVAVVRYRNQQLDEAIALWDKALKLDPGFEPARGYRTRALELKRRLNALDAS
ncbi:hypothetical protein CJ010_05400 [Azoarcus sp. DD4]|nr:hypothetical protein CJ010_05400 [Azoarcus sp. DD4]